jgi:hypothetical protein
MVRIERKTILGAMTLLTIVLFVLVSAAIVGTWNRFFPPVQWRVALALWLLCAAYQATTLFTARVDLPANLAYVAYPWQATGHPAVNANTGILFTQIAPWTRIARDTLLAGDAPLWNRMSAGGAPLAANQQTAIFHPFTLLGILLPIGKAFTLSASLRLFLVAFFTFILLRNWEITTVAAIFGAVAYTFCSFHIVWLLFPLGLATMMLPMCMTGVQELVRDARGRSYALLLLGLSLAVLGGHPESALWVWIVTMLFAIFTCGNLKRLAVIASAFVIAMLLTAFFWLPTLRVLRETPRYQSVQSREVNPADHGLTYEWLLPLITPNVMGTPVNGTYTPPRGHHAAVLNDYGEVASSYAGLATLALAVAAPFAVTRRRPLAIAVSLMLFSLLTFAEAPLWRDLVRSIPFAGISIHQRLRVFWDLGVCIAAALTVDAAIRGERLRRIAIAFAVVIAGFAAIYAVRSPPVLHDPIALAQFLVPIATAILVVISFRRPRRIAMAATLLVFADLAVATYRYNPTSEPADVFPLTGAIAALQRGEKPFRFAAWGWSFLPDTPGYYGIEDIKTTDPIQNAHYMRLMRGYLNADPASYDQVLRDASQPFFDYLNIRSIYVPPGESLRDPRFVEIYRGSDGTVLQNTRALPRYFLVQHFIVEPSFDRTVALSKQIRDFRVDALVDQIPAKVFAQSDQQLGGGSVTVHRYAANDTALDITSNGWNLLVTSDVNWPGWRAYWNGRRQRPVIVNGAFLGCFIPPGRGQLVFRYRPDEFTRGLQLSAAGLLLLVTFAIVRKVRAN